MKKIKSEKGVVSVLVLVTIIFITAILVSAYMANATQRRSQLRSQLRLKNTYESYWVELEDPSTERTYVTNNGSTKLFVGDYVNYNPGTEGSYTAKKEKTGGTEDRTYNLSAYTGKWQVLGAENGRILLVSSDIIDNVQLKGVAGYANSENILNEICAIYGNGKCATGARSITIDDIDHITGYNPKNIGVRDVEKKGEGDVFQYSNAGYADAPLGVYGNEIGRAHV